MSAPWGVKMWPRSPAAPFAPRRSFPPVMMLSADAGGDLHEQQVLDVTVDEDVLAERHDVHVVVDEHGDREHAGHKARDVEAVPARHDRRAHRATHGVLHGARHTDPDAHQVVAPSAAGQQILCVGQYPVKDGLGTVGNVDRRVDAVDRLAGKVREPERRVACAEVGSQDDPGVGVETKLHRRASTGRRGLPHGGQQVGAEQHVDLRADGRAGESGVDGELRPGARLTVEHDGQDIGCLAGPGCQRGNARRHLQVLPGGVGGPQRHGTSEPQRHNRLTPEQKFCNQRITLDR